MQTGKKGHDNSHTTTGGGRIGETSPQGPARKKKGDARETIDDGKEGLSPTHALEEQHRIYNKQKTS